MTAPRKLNNQVKRYIVRALATYETPSQVAEGVKAEFGLTLPRQRIAAYDPTVKAGAKLSREWRELFDQTRKAFLRDTGAIGISHLPYRLRAIERMYVKAVEANDTPLALKCLQQAAEDIGGIYTNARVVTTNDPFSAWGSSNKTSGKGKTEEELAALYAESISDDPIKRKQALADRYAQMIGRTH
jgi:hypothetical protein